MTKKSKDFDSLKQQLESEIKAIDDNSDNLEKSLTSYKKAISLSKDLLSLLNKHEKDFELLKKEADDIQPTYS